MIGAIEVLISGLGFQFETIVTIVFAMSGLILFALGLKRALILNLLIFTILTTSFYAVGMDFTKPLVIILMHIVIMALSLYTSKQVSEGII